MAGSLNHIVKKNGSFTMNHIENMGDAHEALAEMFDIIAFLIDGDEQKLSNACNAANGPMPCTVPILGKGTRW